MTDLLNVDVETNADTAADGPVLLSALAKAWDVEAATVEVLRKSGPAEGPAEEAREPIMHAILARWRSRQAALRGALARNLDRMVHYYRTALHMPAERTPGSLAPVVQWSARALMVDHFSAFGRDLPNEWTTNSAAVDDWRRAGIRLPNLTVATLVDSAYVPGNIAGRTGQEVPPDWLDQLERRERAVLAPRELAYAREYATIRAGAYLAKLGAGLAATAEEAHLASLRAAIRTHIVERSTEDGWKDLARRLRASVDDAGRQRDMDRVAVTETRAAYNVGRLMAYAADGVETVYYEVSPTACALCRRLLLDEHSQPRQFPLSAILDEIWSDAGGMNIGRATADWRPGAVVHPWCQCRPVRGDLPRVPQWGSEEHAV
jgi:hypothetical protein